MERKRFNIQFLVMIAVIVSLMIVLIISSCTIQLPGVKLPSRECSAKNIDKFRCSDNAMSVEQCTGSAGAYFWVGIDNCAEKTTTTATAMVCDYYAGMFATAKQPPCVDGCNYMGYGVKLWDRGCINSTTFGECRPTGAKILDCSLKGCTCYNGFGGTCIGQQELSAISSAAQLTYDQDISSSVGGNPLNEGNLPYVLARGRFIDELGDNKNDVEYSQLVQFTPGNGKLTLGKSDGSDAGTDYLFFDAGVPLYTYMMNLDNPVIFSTIDARSDLVGTTLVIMGRKFTIKDTDESLSSYMTLSDGSSTYKLTNGGGVALNGAEDEIPGSHVDLIGKTSEGLSSGEAIRIAYAPAEAVYIPVGGSFVDHMFGNFQINLDSVETVDGQAYGNISFGKKIASMIPTVCEEPEAAPASAAPAPEGVPVSEGIGHSGGGGGGGGGGAGGGAVFGGSIISRLRVAERSAMLQQTNETEQLPAVEQKQSAAIPEKAQVSALSTAAKRSNAWIALIAAIVVICAVALIIYIKKKKSAI